MDTVHQSSPLTATDSSLLTDAPSKLQRWRENYSTALNKPPLPASDPLHCYSSGVETDTISLDPPTLDEVRAAIKKLPTGRAPGADGITGEMLKAARDSVAPRLHNLCRMIWRDGAVPPAWKEGVLVSYKNKGDRRNPASYRPITLLSIPSKVVCSIILSRIQPFLVAKRRPQQAGFTPGRSNTDCILALRILAQQRREFEQPLFAASI